MSKDFYYGFCSAVNLDVCIDSCVTRYRVEYMKENDTYIILELENGETIELDKTEVEWVTQVLWETDDYGDGYDSIEVYGVKE